LSEDHTPAGNRTNDSRSSVHARCRWWLGDRPPARRPGHPRQV